MICARCGQIFLGAIEFIDKKPHCSKCVLDLKRHEIKKEIKKEKMEIRSEKFFSNLEFKFPKQLYCPKCRFMVDVANGNMKIKKNSIKFEALCSQCGMTLTFKK